MFLCKFNREAFLNLNTFLIFKKQQNPVCSSMIKILSNYNSLPFGLHKHSCQISTERGLNQGTAPEPPHKLWALKGSLNPDPDTILSEHRKASAETCQGSKAVQSSMQM